MVFQSDTTYFFLALPRDVARFFVTRGIIARAEGTSLVGGSRKNFKFGGSEMQFSALVMRYVSEKSTSNMKMANNCKSLISK